MLYIPSNLHCILWEGILNCSFKQRYGLKVRQRSQYSYWLRVGRPRGRSSSPGRVKNFVFSTSSGAALGPIQHAILVQWVPEALTPGVKLPERESDHSTQISAEVKKMWIYTSNPPYVFKA
jgi:hypothetical protein